MRVKACLNGGRSRAEHPAVPLTPAELAAEALESVDAGAELLHLHPRDAHGRETLDPEPCAEAVRAVRAACRGTPFGLSSGLWIAGGDERRRLELIAGWSELPDFVSVNLSEPGAVVLCELLLGRGVGVEAGLWRAEDGRALVASRLGDRVARILVEPHEADGAAAVATAAAIEAAVAELDAPRLHHGYDAATWAVIDAALDLGVDVRVGLEDTLTLPGGAPASGNAELVTEAVRRRDARR